MEAAVQEYLINGGNKSDAYRKGYNTEKMKDVTINRKAHDLFNLPHVKARIGQHAAKIEKKFDITKEWIYKELLWVVENSKLQEKIDTSGINKAIDTLNKMQGYYAPTKTENEHTHTGVGMSDLYKKVES